MRRTVRLATIATILAAAYAATPLYSAFRIREAVRSGDIATLSERIDFVSLRQSLKVSIGELHNPATERRAGRGPSLPALWSRIKAMVVPGVADGFIDRHVTPEGLPRLEALRAAWRTAATSAVPAEARTRDEADRAAGATMTRFRSFWSRIDHATFVSPREFELQLRDQRNQDRRYAARLQLRGLTWTLTSVRVTGPAFETQGT